MTTWGPALATVLAAVIALVSNLVGIRYTKRLTDSEGRRRPPYRSSAIDRWGWVSIGAAALSVVAVGLAVGTAWTWIAGAVAVAGVAAVVAWWGWRRMPLLTREARQWLDTWFAANEGSGGLPYRREPVGLAERTYTVQTVSRVGSPRRNRSLGESREAVLTPDKLLSRGVDVLVTGAAGVGKSTNLRHFSSPAAVRFWAGATKRDSPRAAAAPGLVPVLLSARDLVDKSSIEAALGQPAGMLTRAPARGAKWLVLVDAVDEVLDAEQRRRVWDLLLDTVQVEGPRRFVITSRSVDSTRWRDLGFRGIAHYRLHPFTDEQLGDFAARHQSSSVVPDAESRLRAEGFVEHVRFRALTDVVRLPLLAKLAADLYFDHRSRDLSMRRVDLYEHSIGQWLGKFDDVMENQVLRGVPNRERDEVHELLLSLEGRYATSAGDRTRVLRAYLADLAVVHTDVSGVEFSRDLVDVSAELMGAASAAGAPATRLAVGRILEASGLVRDPYHDARFWHQTFAEYLAAPKVAKRCGHSREYWGERLADAATYPGMVFVFHFLNEARQRRVITALTASPGYLRWAALLVAEGLCAERDAERVVAKLWTSRPELGGRLSPVGEEHSEWREAVDVLRDHSALSRFMTEVHSHSDAPIGDRVYAAFMLARIGREKYRQELERWASVGNPDPKKRAHAAVALATLKVERSEVKLKAASENRLRAEDRSIEIVLHIARLDWKRGLEALMEFSSDAVEAENFRKRAANLLLQLMAARGEHVWALLDDDHAEGAEKVLAKLAEDEEVPQHVRGRAVQLLSRK